MGNYSETLKGFIKQSQADGISNKIEISSEDIFVDLNQEGASQNVCLWKPKQENIDASLMKKFQTLIENKCQLKFGMLTTAFKLTFL